MSSKYLINSPSPQTFQEACDALRELEGEVRSCTDTIRQKGKDLILLRFRQGRVAHLALGMRREEHYGQAIMETLSERSGTHPRTLYQALQFYRHPQFEGREVALRQWIEETEEEKGRISWSYCRNWIQRQLPEGEAAEAKLQEETKKLEEAAERLESRARDLEREAERWQSSPDRSGDGEASEPVIEAIGVAEKAREVAEDTRRQVHQLTIVRPDRWESADYLRHVRSYGCLVCSKDADAHHITTGGMGTKGHDLFTVPLCREHHGELHTIGGLSFQEKYQLNLWQNVAYAMGEYFTQMELVKR